MAKAEEELVDRALTAKLLRQLADRIEAERVRVTVIEHRKWAHDKSEWLTVKWEPVKE